MRFLLDESADTRLADYLTELGHDATTVAHHHTASLGDSEVLAIAHGEGRILITNDRDFGELVFRRQEPHSGVILFRLRTTRLAAKIDRLHYVLSRYADRLNEFIVVTDRRVRVRQVT